MTTPTPTPPDLDGVEAGLSREREALAEARFLCARLRELDDGDMGEHCAREFYGHVIPSLARLETLLATPATEQTHE